MALRLQCFGYKIRLGAYHGDGFKEGVSLTVYDELARWEKYAYGCNELLFHPVRFWFVRGPFTPLLKKFLWSNMPIVSYFLGQSCSAQFTAHFVDLEIFYRVLKSPFCRTLEHTTQSEQPLC
jgi:hypothetical protein